MNDPLDDLFGEVQNLRKEIELVKQAIAKTQQAGAGLFNNQKELNQRMVAAENAVALVSSHLETIAAPVRRSLNLTLPAPITKGAPARVSEPGPLREPTKVSEPSLMRVPQTRSEPGEIREPSGTSDPRYAPNPEPAQFSKAKPRKS